MYNLQTMEATSKEKWISTVIVEIVQVMYR